MTTQSLSALTMLLYRHTKRREFIALLGGVAATRSSERCQWSSSSTARRLTGKYLG